MSHLFPLEILRGLRAPASGLSTQDVAARQEQYGRNVIIETVDAGWRKIVAETFKDPMLWFLLGTSALFAAIGEMTDSLILLAALIPLFGMDAFLHRRTRASMEGLSGRLASYAVVVRNGAQITVTATDLVPGDVVVLKIGDLIPADGLFFHADQTQVDESALTGEAYPVRKHALQSMPPADDETRFDDCYWGYAGTRMLTGNGRLLVAFTSRNTLYGEIVQAVASSGHERTPLQRAVMSLVKVLIVAAVLFCLILASIRISQGYGWVDALLSALTLAVAAIPEEFPVVLTFFLGAGAYRLAKIQALVRRSVVVESIGRVTCICTDKTGTLTKGSLQLMHHVTSVAVSESRLLALAGAASRRETGDPMDIAILKRAPDFSGLVPVKSFPFTEDRKCEVGVFREDDVLIAAVKGAPEIVLKLCDFDASAESAWMDQVGGLANAGHKVIACAWRELNPEDWEGGEPVSGYQFAGLLAFEDPVRGGVPEALQACLRANIHVIMVTGDHPATAAAVAREIGLSGDAPRMIDGNEMEIRLKRDGGAFLQNIDVVARAIPMHKLHLVKALQQQGGIVAVTGDGVNDVPALQAADIGIAMGQRGTRSAREAAAIVLLDDNFRSIVRAIAEGRQLFSNLQKSFQYLLMIHLPLVMSAALIPMAGYPLLYLPIHIVWLELIIHPTAMLVFQGMSRHDQLEYQPPHNGVKFFNRRQWASILMTSAAILVVVITGYVLALDDGGDVAYARAMALVTLTVSSSGIAAVLSRLRGLTAQVTVGASLLVSMMLVQIPELSTLLHTEPLHPKDLAYAVGGGLLASLISFSAKNARYID